MKNLMLFVTMLALAVSAVAPQTADAQVKNELRHIMTVDIDSQWTKASSKSTQVKCDSFYVRWSVGDTSAARVRIMPVAQGDSVAADTVGIGYVRSATGAAQGIIDWPTIKAALGGQPVSAAMPATFLIELIFDGDNVHKGVSDKPEVRIELLEFY